MSTNPASLIIKNLGLQPYETCYTEMRASIDARIAQKKQHNLLTNDELWLVEHPSTLTLGQAGKESHLINASAIANQNIPVVKTDRGGQVTWHGRGQLIAYFLFDLLRLDWNVRQLVSIAENTICELLSPYLKDNLTIKARKDAPGVYIFDSVENTTSTNSDRQLGKIASLGFKIKRGFCYHGIAININADLTAFDYINPCGYEGMRMLNLTDVSKPDKNVNLETLQQELVQLIQKQHLSNS